MDKHAFFCGALAVVGFAGTSPAWATQPQLLPTIPVQTLPENKPAPTVTLGAVDVTIGGFIKADAIFSDFSRGDAVTANGRDFYVPNSIPVGATSNAQRSLDLHAKETRLFIKTDMTFADDIKIGSYVEFDFLVSPGTGTSAVTNAYNPGLRRAYVTYGNFLLGQDWTTFQNVSTLPEGLDFIGPTEATPFGRQPLVRYSISGWQFALENPETSLLANGGASRVITDDNVYPDLIVRYDFKGDYGVVSLSGLARQLRSKIAAPATLASNDTTLAGGLSIAAKLNIGRDDVRLAISGGEGIGRYIGINTITDAVVESSDNLKAIPLVAGYLAYRHVWSEKWRSTVTASVINAYNSTSAGTSATKRADSVHANLLYSPVPKITFGAEAMAARRETETQYGYLKRLQFSVKYAF